MNPRKKHSINAILLGILCFIIFAGSIGLIFLPIFSTLDTDAIKIDNGVEVTANGVFDLVPELKTDISLYDITKEWILGDKGVDDVIASYNKGEAEYKDVVKVATARGYVQNNSTFISYMVIIYLSLGISFVAMILSLLSPFFAGVNTTTIVLSVLNIVVFGVGIIVGSVYIGSAHIGVQALALNYILTADYNLFILAYLGIHIVALAMVVCMTLARKYNLVSEEYNEL